MDRLEASGHRTLPSKRSGKISFKAQAVLSFGRQNTTDSLGYPVKKKYEFHAPELSYEHSV